MIGKLLDTKEKKIYASPIYNYIFNKIDGTFCRWGKTAKDDPQMSPFPEILDIEVTTKCNGIPGSGPCPFCYKSNTLEGKNMSFETFKTILDKFPKGLTQIAFGADSEAITNPELFLMMGYARFKGIIPNITVANISDDTANILSGYCGAVAISRYHNKNICYDSVKKLTDLGMNQVNIHMMVSEETFDNCIETIFDRVNDSRLGKLNAIVFLSLKQKGRGFHFNPLKYDKFEHLIKIAISQKINFGMDSCSSTKFLRFINQYPKYKKLETYVEPCESTLFSSYINVDGKFFPCSFCDGGNGWDEGLDVVSCDNFTKDIWENVRTVEFRNNLIKAGRCCPVYTV